MSEEVVQYRRRSGCFGLISDSEPGMALLLIWLSVWRTPGRGFRRFWTASMELCVKVFRMSCWVVAGLPFSAVFGSGLVFIECSCRWRSMADAGPRCADLSRFECQERVGRSENTAPTTPAHPNVTARTRAIMNDSRERGCADPEARAVQPRLRESDRPTPFPDRRRRDQRRR